MHAFSHIVFVLLANKFRLMQNGTPLLLTEAKDGTGDAGTKNTGVERAKVRE
jgi:hypothetical protein